MNDYVMPSGFLGMLRMSLARDVPFWDKKEGDIVLNLGAGNKHIDGSEELDLPDWDAEEGVIPYGSSTVSTIYAMHFFEHLRDPRPILRECQRVLKPGGLLNIGVPYYTSQMAYHDLDHKSWYTEETWRNLFSTEYYDKGNSNDKTGWKFDIGLNLIVGLVERNTMLITQLTKRA